MNNLLPSPDLINCTVNGGGGVRGETIAHQAALSSSVDGAKWAVSKGVDLTVKTPDTRYTAYDVARILTLEHWNFSPERRARAVKLPAIVKPLAPALATRSCSELDGQILGGANSGYYPLPLYEYCIVAENLQSSIETEVSQSLKRLIGVDYIYKAEKYLSGTALYPGYKATITFTCASGTQDCGPAYVPGDRWSDNFLNLVKRTFGLSVKCSDSGNLLDVDSIEPGESVSVTHSSDTERSSPWYRNCEAISGGPFTLSIKTTRLARPPL